MRGLLIALALLALAAPASATTYRGMHTAHGTLSFEVENDRVVAYKIDTARGNTCEFTAAGDRGVFAPVALQGGAFSYRLATAIELDGRFDGRTGSGTLQLRRRASGENPACDTGPTCWSVAVPGSTPPALCAGTDITPPKDDPIPLPEPTPVPADPGTKTPEHAGPPQPPALHRASVSVRRSAKRLSGRVSSSQKACRGSRTVVLLRGSKTLARTKTKADGSFDFRRSSRTRNHRVRVSVAQRTLTPKSVCATASKSFKG